MHEQFQRYCDAMAGAAVWGGQVRETGTQQGSPTFALAGHVVNGTSARAGAAVWGGQVRAAERRRKSQGRSPRLAACLVMLWIQSFTLWTAQPSGAARCAKRRGIKHNGLQGTLSPGSCNLIVRSLRALWHVRSVCFSRHLPRISCQCVHTADLTLECRLTFANPVQAPISCKHNQSHRWKWAAGALLRVSSAPKVPPYPRGPATIPIPAIQSDQLHRRSWGHWRTRCGDASTSSPWACPLWPWASSTQVLTETACGLPIPGATMWRLAPACVHAILVWAERSPGCIRAEASVQNPQASAARDRKGS